MQVGFDLDAPEESAFRERVCSERISTSSRLWYPPVKKDMTVRSAIRGKAGGPAAFDAKLSRKMATFRGFMVLKLWTPRWTEGIPSYRLSRGIA